MEPSCHEGHASEGAARGCSCSGQKAAAAIRRAGKPALAPKMTARLWQSVFSGEAVCMLPYPGAISWLEAAATLHVSSSIAHHNVNLQCTGGSAQLIRQQGCH